MKPRFFRSPQQWRAWLDGHHASEQELWVGFHKRTSKKPSITWPESVDEALCYGWIDGIRKSLDDSSYMIRFTPRKPTSIWSAVNVTRVAELTKKKRMHPAGLDAFSRRTPERTGIYSFERAATALPASFEQEFKVNRAAWAFFDAEPPGYRRTAIWWVMSAKREETRLKRLRTLIADAAKGQRIRLLRRPDAPNGRSNSRKTNR
jgi:uncharacterized protein YdeI (YjbR/CyaY-like superfamily)